MAVVDNVLTRVIKRGNLRVTFSSGQTHSFGDGTGPLVAVRLTAAAERTIPIFPGLYLGEAYMDGGLKFEEGRVWDLIEIVGRNLEGKRLGARTPTARALAGIKRRLGEWNDRNASRRNVAHHYDLSADLYRRFLDADMQYSCAYFARPDMTLDQAQAAKKTHIAAKLLLQPGQRVLDIGCGWGGTALELARTYGVEVTGITLSKEQLAIARQRASDEGLEGKVRFELIDYRDVKGEFDRIVSIGMFEHVGHPNYDTYFGAVRSLLAPDGVALIHSIGRHDGPGVNQAWVRKYIFPGGAIPCLSEATPAIERAGLWVTDIEILRLHYAETLRHWRERFLSQWDEVADIYDERFCRMWEFYLAFSELAFRYMGHMVFQAQLTRRLDAVPITRDYGVETERAHAGR